MITEVRPMPGKEWKECVFKNGSMSNEDYHAAPGISSSGLVTVLKSLGDYKYQDPEEMPKRALEFGTASHAVLLENGTFNDHFYRDVSESDEGMIGSERGCDSAVMAELKRLDVPKRSGKKGQELYDMLLAVNPNAKILCVERDRLAAKNEGKTAVRADDWDKLMKMRRVMLAHPDFKQIIDTEKMFFETSIFCQVKVQGCDDWIDVKLRPDVITKDYKVPDYKTTGLDLDDEVLFGFDSHAVKLKYHMRLWFTCDVLSAIYGKRFTPSLLTQRTVSPYPAANVELDVPAVEWHARMQYTEALIKYAGAVKSNKWPIHYSRTRKINVPHWMNREHEEYMENNGA